jgi:polar amino acid transport system permease protein
MFEFLHTNGRFLLMGSFPNGPLGGLTLTLVLSLLGLVLAFPLGLALALCRIAPVALLRMISGIFVYVMRGIPLIMLIFWSYFLVPRLTGHAVSAFTALVVTLVLYQSAYLCEVIRAGVEALPKGQLEASRSLGMTYGQTMRMVILPQALFNMLPSLLGQFVALVKDTSIGYVISVYELTFSAQQINNSLLTRPFEVFFTLALVYFVVCYSLTQGVNLLERRINRKSGQAAVKLEVTNVSVV